MAEMPHSTTRRALLGAAAALPFAAALAPPVIAGSAATRQSGGTDAALDCFAPLAMTWKARLGCYRRIAAEAEEAATTGWFAAANARYERAQAAIAARFGSWEAAADHAQGAALRRAAFKRVSKAEDDYWKRCTAPMQRAAVALALTPPPDLEALRAKIAVMREAELHGLPRMKRDCLEVLEEDVGRLQLIRSSES